MNSEFQSLPPETQEAVKRTMDTMEQAQTPAEIRETLEGTQKGGVKNSIRNCLTVYLERAEVHILEDEAAVRAYIEQMWAEALTIYRSGKYKLSFSIEMNRYLNAHQQDFMQEDTQAGMAVRRRAWSDRHRRVYRNKTRLIDTKGKNRISEKTQK